MSEAQDLVRTVEIPALGIPKSGQNQPRVMVAQVVSDRVSEDWGGIERIDAKSVWCMVYSCHESYF